MYCLGDHPKGNATLNHLIQVLLFALLRLVAARS